MLQEVVCELVGLEKIECGDNRVRSVPKAVSKLTRLTLLSLKNNNLRTLPKELGQVHLSSLIVTLTRPTLIYHVLTYVLPVPGAQILIPQCE